MGSASPKAYASEAKPTESTGEGDGLNPQLLRAGVQELITLITDVDRYIPVALQDLIQPELKPGR